jgi:hypothetical protein
MIQKGDFKGFIAQFAANPDTHGFKVWSVKAFSCQFTKLIKRLLENGILAVEPGKKFQTPLYPPAFFPLCSMHCWGAHVIAPRIDQQLGLYNTFSVILWHWYFFLYNYQEIAHKTFGSSPKSVCSMRATRPPLPYPLHPPYRTKGNTPA